MLELLLFQDKRKIQEEISQKRLKIEEEKLKHQHLKVIYYFNFISIILYSNILRHSNFYSKDALGRKKISTVLSHPNNHRAGQETRKSAYEINTFWKLVES